MRWAWWFLAFLGVIAGALLVVRVAHPLPSLASRVASFSPIGGLDTPLARGIAPQLAAHPDESGVHLLDSGRDSYAARAALARGARSTLDVQYYIWKHDVSGTLLLEDLHRAAERGVLVRLLLDDNGVDGLDGELASLDAHPAIEVRLYNPFVVRSPKAIGYATDFLRLNRRMHNKSFTADGAATIVGGRNIGDEYFRAGDADYFADLDVLGVGPMVAATSRAFDTYWNSASAYPAALILPAAKVGGLNDLRAQARSAERSSDAIDYLAAIAQRPIVAAMANGTLDFVWTRATLVCDPPEKTLGTADQNETLAQTLREALGTPERRLDVVSAYFVPTDAGTTAFEEYARRKIDVAVLTNAWEATDVGIVHAGYIPYRKRLLRAGVRLYEMRGSSGDGRRILATGSGSGSGTGAGTAIRSSGSTLHAKAFAVDGRRIFIGSFNFDPRSMHLNTEMGFVLHSPILARRLEIAFADQIPRRSYEVILAPNGRLRWIERGAGGLRRIHDSEPGLRWWHAAGLRVLTALPIEWML